MPSTEHAPRAQAPEAGTTRVVSLREITDVNVRAVCALEVEETQKRNVAANAVSLAEAYVHRDAAWPRAVYAGDELVGFVMIYDPRTATEPEEPDFFLWRLMIDRRAQGRGYGRAAVHLAIEYARSRGAARVMVSHVRETAALGAFYASFGFAYTGREDGRELYMALDLR
ncbi:MAG TPA: GNAT family N-acetyltransferase [Burkholderiaceae bacterium]|nr:GNAT family N-acetyltransferase [Burkholderiaceae bacterium]